MNSPSARSGLGLTWEEVEMLKSISKVFIFCIVASLAYASQPIQEKSGALYQELGQSNISMNLKGISEFVFMAGFTAGNKEETAKVNAILAKELSNIGKVMPSSILVKKDKEDVIDLKGFDKPLLCYQMAKLYSSDGKELDVVKASLTLSTSIEILDTKQKGSGVVWSKSCFMKGSAQKNIEEAVSQTFNFLIGEFSKSYSSVNSEKPLFNTYEI